MTIVFGQMVLSMMDELQPRGPQLTRTDHLEGCILPCNLYAQCPVFSNR